LSLIAGTRLGPYEIQSPLGAGGMGEVYRARDTRLERTVAVKVLPQHLSSSADSRQRFEREAKTISQLSHPHICALHVVGSQDGIEYLVMEHLEGETLSERLARGPLPLEQTLRFGQQIADALDKAHRQGIVHRDLKPANVMLTKTGVKLLDFGLAKVLEPAASKDSLTSLPTKQALTQEGTILGTFQYMSPEQLEGKDADARTDIFALGATLYEMATGRKAFAGASQASLISSIMTADPPSISAAQPMSPPALDRVVKTCLAKDPEDRWQSAADVGRELKWIGEGSAAGVAAPAAVVAGRRNRERLAWIAGLLLIGTAAAVLSPRLLSRPASTAEPIRFDIRPPFHDRFDSAPWLSPDGRSIAFVGPDGSRTRRLWIRSLGSVEPVAVEGIGNVDEVLSVGWAPDGRSLAFSAEGKLKRIGISGGTPQAVCDTQSAFGISWSPSGELIYTPFYGSPVMRVAASGGTPAPVTALDKSAGEVAHLWPKFLSDGRRFLYFARTKQGRESHQGWIASGSLDSRQSRRIRPADELIGVAEGRLLFVAAGTMYAQPFDEKTLTVREEPVALAGRPFVNGSNVAVLAEVVGRTLIFRSDPPALRRMVVRDRSGRKLAEVGSAEPFGNRVAISPDGRRALISRRNPQKGQSESCVLDLERGTSARSGSGIQEEVYPVWAPDGERFVFSWDRDGPYDMVSRRLDGSAPDEILLLSPFDKTASDWSRDGKTILFTNSDPGSFGTAYLQVGSKDPPKRVPGSERTTSARLSADGRWVLWSSADSGRREVYVQRFPDGSGRQQVSVNGGAAAHWSPDGREIFFLSPDGKIMAASFDATGGAPRISIPAPLFAATRAQLESAYVGSETFNWDVFPDGQRFLVCEPVSEIDPTAITVVLDWQAQLTK
jgi:eukaryotic-like serine/threonine-protein kinase